MEQSDRGYARQSHASVRLLAETKPGIRNVRSRDVTDPCYQLPPHSFTRFSYVTEQRINDPLFSRRPSNWTCTTRKFAATSTRSRIASRHADLQTPSVEPLGLIWRGAAARVTNFSAIVSLCTSAPESIADLHVPLAGFQRSKGRSDHRNTPRRLSFHCEIAAESTIAWRNRSSIESGEVAGGLLTHHWKEKKRTFLVR